MTQGLAVSPHCRVIVDHDYQGDPGGLVALTHRRVYTDLDFRLIVADMLARFRLHESERRRRHDQ